ncbi:MAG: MFS transporter [Acidobacteriota bacterium]
MSARADGGEALANAVVYGAFAATGVGVVLPGTLLPLLLERWALNDAQGGVLLFLFFVGSTSGALLARSVLPRTVAMGCAAIAVSAAAMAVASPMAAFAAIPVYGVGMGVVMTSISLLVSRRFPASRTAQMARLNMAWSVGALVGPPVLLRGVATLSVPAVLDAAAVFFATVGVVVWAAVPHAEAEVKAVPSTGKQKIALPVLLMLIAVPLATGTESAMGGWLSTYAKRSGDTLGLMAGAVTCFWAGMLLSRMVQSHVRVAEATQKATLRWGPVLMVIAVAVVMASHGGVGALAGALVAGIGVGPMYPLLLALVLRHGEGGNVVFVIAGVGAASLPLLTGVISHAAGSLRTGLAAPLAGAVGLMLVCWLVARRPEAGI